MLVAEGGGGNGRSKTIANSRNSFSRPACICLAIMGKWFSRSWKLLISFFFGIMADSLDSPSGDVPFCCIAIALLVPSTITAGVILISSHDPTSGRDM